MLHNQALQSGRSTVRMKSTERHGVGSLSAQVYSGEEGSEEVPARDPEPTAAYRSGVIGEEGPGEGWGGFSIVTCPLSIARGSQGALCPGTGSGKQGISVRGQW
jgi:hypothetical protein